MKNKYSILGCLIFSLFILIGHSQVLDMCNSTLEIQFNDEEFPNHVNKLPNSVIAVFFENQFDNDTIEIYDSENNLLHIMKPLKTSIVLGTTNVGYPWDFSKENTDYIKLLMNKKECVKVSKSVHYRFISVFWQRDKRKWYLRYSNAMILAL